jgi:hypothetical protein
MLRVGDVVQYVRRTHQMDDLLATGDLGAIVAVYPDKAFPYDVWFEVMAAQGCEDPAILKSDELALVTETVEH